ncbi:MAG: SpoIIE family protein phosphatase [Firmicutes bacterium]|nr:SpoIIE family protein phosphatase [Bacillota bacterium]
MKEESLYTGSSITVDERLSLKKIRWRLSERLAGLKEMALSRGELLLLGMLGFLLGRATLMGEVATFGAIFWLVLLREKPLQSYLVAATVLLGRATVLGWLSTGHLLVAIFLIWVWEALCLRLWKKKSPLVVSVVLLIVLSSPILVSGITGAFDGAFLGLEVLIGLLVSITLVPAVHVVGQLPRIRDRPDLTSEEILAMFLLFSLALIGIGTVEIAGISVVSLFSKLLLLVSAYLIGAGGGAAMGVIVGIILGLGNPYLYLVIGSLAFSGFWAGFMRQFGRLGSASGYILSFPFFALLEPSAFSEVYQLDNLLALGIFLLIPTVFYRWASGKLPRGTAIHAGEVEKEYLGKVATKIQRLSNLFSELSENFSQITGNEQRPIEAEMAPFINDIVNRACKTCLMKDRCWGKDFYRNFRWIIDLLARTEGEIKEYHLSPDFRVKCRSPASLLTAINCSREVWKANRYWVNKLTEERNLVSSQLEGVSLIMEEMAEEVKTNPLQSANERVSPLFTVEVGVAQKPGKGQKVCGDYYSVFEFGENLQVLALSDGMGQGPRAQAESKAAVKLIEKMLEAGFGKEMVIRVVNSLLQLRTLEEFFATMDLALINLGTGEIESIKIGAAPSFQKRGKDVNKIGAASLPLGILSHLEIEQKSIGIQSGDLYVMVSDGVYGNSDAWLSNFLNHCEYNHPEIVAGRILEEAMLRCEIEDKHDDMTVIACRIIPLNRQVARKGSGFKKEKVGII